MDAPVSSNEEIDVSELLRRVWRHKLIVIAFTIACGSVAAALAFTATRLYRAQVAIVPAPVGADTAAGSVTSQLSGLASLAGFNLGSANDNQREARAVLNSRHLVEEFIVRKNLQRELSVGDKKPPTLWATVNQFEHSILNIRDDVRTGVTTVSIEWRDPAVAAQWANEFVALANEVLRKRAMDLSRRNIAYLKDQAVRTNDVDLQRVMYDLMEGETKKLMVANGRTEYAFSIVDPAVPPELPSSPHRILITLGGLAIGMILGALAASIYDRRRPPEGQSAVA